MKEMSLITGFLERGPCSHRNHIQSSSGGLRAEDQSTHQSSYPAKTGTTSKKQAGKKGLKSRQDKI